MRDCRLVLEVKDEKVGMEGQGISVMEMAELCGVLQVVAGKMALERGVDIDSVKDAMLDVHLAAMMRLEENKKDD